MWHGLSCLRNISGYVPSLDQQFVAPKSLINFQLAAHIRMETETRSLSIKIFVVIFLLTRSIYSHILSYGDVPRWVKHLKIVNFEARRLYYGFFANFQTLVGSIVKRQCPRAQRSTASLSRKFRKIKSKSFFLQKY